MGNAHKLILAVFFLFLVFFFLLPSSAFAATTPFRSASIITTNTTGEFINIGNCSATDGLTCDHPLGNGGASLYFRGFGTYADFGVPHESKITKVRVRVTGKSTYGVGVIIAAGPQDCRWGTTTWGLFSSQTINTQMIVSELTDQWWYGAVRTFCFQPQIFDNDKITWQIRHSSGQAWSANIDNFEIAFDYNLPAIPTPTPTPTITPSPTPTPTPSGPEPFLDLPWDYTGKKFTDEVFRINSYFDHEYPLIFSESGDVSSTVVDYLGRRGISNQDIFYSGHNGYDYDLDSDTSVLAAASGTATYLWDKSGGNTIMINHHNKYFTWYLHMQPEDLITNIPNNPVTVTKGQMIGKVGSTGEFTFGPHLHFSVIKDVNDNDTFDWNSDYPFGLTDPYKWRGDGNNGTLKDDPWPLYQSGDLHGSVSDYLWTKPTDATVTQIPKSGATINQNNLSLTFLVDAISATLNVKIEEHPSSSVSDIIKGVGHSFDLNASDQDGNSVKTFLQPVTLVMDYASQDISNFIENSLSFFYFDPEQMEWIIMPSVIDTQNKTVTTQTTHFTQFAVMGELKDTQPPLTTFEVVGDKGQDNWYRSDVIVSIIGEDNEDGLGVKQIFYSIGDNLHWQEYVDPLHFVQEGHYKIFTRAIDKAENVQKDDSVLEFDVDKTLPQTSIDANPTTIWPPNGKMTDILVTGNATDKHLFKKTITVKDEYQKVEPVISDFGQTIQLEARRDGVDTDGRVYILKVEVEDLAGNKAEKQIQVTVPHDQGKKK